MRKIQNFMPDAAQSPRGAYWKNVKEELEMIPGSWMEKEKKLPYHPIYVYSSEFLASVMLLVYEVLAHTFSPLPTRQVAAKLTLEAHVQKPMGHKRKWRPSDHSLHLAGNMSGWQFSSGCTCLSGGQHRILGPGKGRIGAAGALEKMSWPVFCDENSNIIQRPTKMLKT